MAAAAPTAVADTSVADDPVDLAKFGRLDDRIRTAATPGGDVGHYDRSGRSADKLLVRRPLRDGWLNTPLGLQRHPILGTTHMHTGVDWDAPLASAIVAAGAEHGHPPNHGADRRLRRRILPRRMRAHNADPACGHHALTVARPPLTMIAAMERRRVARGRKQ